MIDETWGDLVADHVIRRYANPAERDADLAGFTVDELKGQVCVLGTMVGGLRPYLEIHNGAAWVAPFLQMPATGVKIQGGVVAGTSNGFACLNIGFPVPMEFGTHYTIAIHCTPADLSGYFPSSELCVVSTLSPSATGFVATFTDIRSGVGFANQAVACAWLAMVGDATVPILRADELPSTEPEPAYGYRVIDEYPGFESITAATAPG
ncbi:MAG TPA: hypothetical protein VHS03_07080 [Gaiellaceae bacterium]|nr:hypothetical protein [Gaiellaceae bacterium]